MERVFGREEVVIIRVTSVQRRFADLMDRFDWQGEVAPMESATSFTHEIFYLVRKVGEPYEYYRAREYEILNTEARAQLFSHSFGYQQKQADFGMTIEKAISEPQPEPDMESQRDELSLDEISQQQHLEANDESMPVSRRIAQPMLCLKVPNKIEPFKGNDSLIIRQFIILRLKTV